MITQKVLPNCSYDVLAVEAEQYCSASTKVLEDHPPVLRTQTLYVQRHY